MTNVDGSADSNPGDANDWRHYRYRVYQAVVPLRNVIWANAPLRHAHEQDDISP